MTASPIVLTSGAGVRRDDLPEVAEVQPHEVERLQVTDPLIQRGRSLHVGEEQGEVADDQALAGDDRLFGEEVEEGLVGEDLRAR